METFTHPKPLVKNPNFRQQRNDCLSGLEYNLIDEPIIHLVHYFNILPYCFTLQSCFGYFLCSDQAPLKNLDPIPLTNTISHVKYRIAYVAVCIEYSERGKKFLNELSELSRIDPDNIQFGCADWFWERQVNSYVLQVEPEKEKNFDQVLLEYSEAIRIEEIRNKFFSRLQSVIGARLLTVSNS